MAFCGRIITQCDHRAWVPGGLSKQELITNIRRDAMEKFGVRISLEFLRKYTKPRLYGFMCSIISGSRNSIWNDWRLWKSDHRSR
jgi:hypothetical protein